MIRQLVLHLIFETLFGQAWLCALERSLGLALVPVEQVV
jgi:hypothetical protein